MKTVAAKTGAVLANIVLVVVFLIVVGVALLANSSEPWMHSTAGVWVVRFLAVLGVAVVFLAGWLIVWLFRNKKPLRAVETVLVGTIVALFLFQPSMFSTTVTLAYDMTSEICGGVGYAPVGNVPLSPLNLTPEDDPTPVQEDLEQCY